MLQKDKCKDTCKIVKTMILIENELSRGQQATDRMLFLEALVKEVKIEYCAANQTTLFKIAEKLNNILINARLVTTKEKMQLISQDLRKVRKMLEKFDFSYTTPKSNVSASAARAFNRKTKDKMRPLLEPMFNVLEIYKQLLLLVDHLSDKSLRCLTCILKHTLFIEALTEEAIGLDCKGIYLNDLNEILRKVKLIRNLYIKEKRNSYCKIVLIVKDTIKLSQKMIDKLSQKDKLKIFS